MEKRTMELINDTVLNDCNYPLNQTHLDVLSRGTSFIPTPTEPYQPELDLTRLGRSINLRAHWLTRPTNDNPKHSLLSNLLKSDWNPPEYFTRDRQEWQQLCQELCTPTETSEPNISKKMLKAWKELVNNPEFYLIKADKGGGLVLWKQSDYKKEAHRQLSDKRTYEPLTPTQVEEFKNKLKILKMNLLHKLRRQGHVTNNEIRLARKLKPTFPPIYFLPKIHKNKRTDTDTFAGRPIIAATNGPLKIFDNWLATLTAPLLEHIPGSLKDTTSLINALNALPPTPGATLFSADVESLYPSIPWEEGFEAATAFYSWGLGKLEWLAKENDTLPPPEPAVFKETLRLVLTNNIFHFQNKLWFRQISGTAMGCSISVYLANTFMYYRTKPIIRNPPTGLKAMFRYIDDIIGVYEGNPANITDIFNNTVDEHIRLTYVIGGTYLEALDLKLHLNDTGKIETSLFKKPTDNHQFVHWSSHHPPHLKRSLPYSQMIRIKRNCSNNEDFESEANTLINRFRARKYPLKILHEARERVRKLDRESLLSHKKTDTNNEDRLTIVTTYQKEWAKLFREKLNENYSKLRNSWTNQNNPLPETKPRLAFRTHRKLGALSGPTYKKGNINL